MRSKGIVAAALCLLVSLASAAEVTTIDGYSAHADRGGLIRWAHGFDAGRLKNIFLVHGEEEPANALAEKLRGRGRAEVTVPVLGQSFEF